MSTILAKIKKKSEWVSVQDQVSIPEWESISFDGAMAYDPNNDTKEIWFYKEDFNQNGSFLPILGQNYDAADLNTLERREFNDIDFIALSHGDKYYIQKVSKGSYIERKALCFGDAAELKEVKDTIYVNPIPNCVYDKTSHKLFFMEMSKVTSIFNGLKLEYKTATNPEVQSFFNSGIVDPTGLDVNSVSIPNRKKITTVMSEYNNLGTQDKEIVKTYVKQMTEGHVEFDEGTQSFKTPDDNILRIVLYGLQRRFYMPPLVDEPQIATSSTAMSSLF